jgi:hypothetical protein
MFELVASQYGWTPTQTGDLTMEQAILLIRALEKRLSPPQEVPQARINQADLSEFGIGAK